MLFRMSVGASLLAAATLATFMKLSPPPAPVPVTDTPPPNASCVAEYSALLDLAELARRYGHSGGVFLDPLGEMFDQLDQCLEFRRNAVMQPLANAIRV